MDATRHLTENLTNYQQVVDYARRLGFNGNAKRLGAQFRQAGSALISMANKTGANIDPMANPSDQFRQAIAHLQNPQNQDQGSGKTLLH